MQPLLQHYMKEFERVTLAHSDIPLHQQRQLALDHLLQTGFPTVKDEHWRYVARHPILQQPFKMGAVSNTIESLDALPLPPVQSSSTLRFICLNGQFYWPSTVSWPEGLTIEPIQNVMRNHPERLTEPGLYEARRLGRSFNDLNTLFSEEGISIHVDRGYTRTPIIELWYVSSGLPSDITDPLMFCVRNEIHLGQDSAIQVVERALTLHEASHVASPSVCMNTFTTLNLQSGSKAKWAQAMHTADHHGYLGQLAVQQQRQSTFQTESLVGGGGLVRNTLSVDLCDQAANCELRGLLGAKRRQQIDQQVVVVHQKDHTKSDIQYRAMADDTGRVSLSGEVIAQHGVHQMQSHQGNHNLLLSDQAEIDTKPRLTLFADDIQCTHGATVGALDAAALFYLQTRGLSEQTARLVLIQAFSQSMWDEMPLLLASDQTLPNIFGAD